MKRNGNISDDERNSNKLRYLCRVSDISQGESKTFAMAYDNDTKKIEIAIFNIEGKFYAISTTKHRNLVIDLGKGLKTNAQLTIPAVGKGPFPGVVIFQGAGVGSVIPPTSYYAHMAEYLSERGFVVLRYDERDVGPNSTIIDSNAWGNIVKLTPMRFQSLIFVPIDRSVS